MSTTEVVFLVRYLGVLVEDQVLKDNDYFRLYKKLQKIVGTVTALFTMKTYL